MQDFILNSTGPTFYGFIAESEADPNQFVLAIRGTSSWVEWWDDLNAIRLVPFKDPGAGLVGAGFARIYDTLEVVPAPTGALHRIPPRPVVAEKAAGGFSQQVSALVKRRAAPARTEALASYLPRSPSPVTVSARRSRRSTCWTMR